MVLNCCVYAWFAKGRIYIGKSHDSPEVRFRGHRKSASVDRPKYYCHRFLKKLLEAGVSPRVVTLQTLAVEITLPEGVTYDKRMLRSFTLDSLDKLEKWWIRYFRQRSPLQVLNLSDGGDGGSPLTDEVKQKLSQALRGRKFSEETIARMREAQQRRCANPKEREKRSKDAKAFYQTDAGRLAAEASSKRNRGRSAWNKGKTMPPVSVETRQKISQAVRAAAAGLSR